jgi:hypothetical protein
MSDLCAALLLALNDETSTYVCFCALMRRVSGHFTAQPTILCDELAALQRLLQHFDPELFAHLQTQQAEHLLFAYRWLLLQLKREFPLDSALTVLEVIWASQPRSQQYEPLVLFDQSFVPESTVGLEEESQAFTCANQDVPSDLDSTSGLSSDPFDSIDQSTPIGRVWPDQMRNVMRSLYSNIEQVMQVDKTQSIVSNSSILDGSSSGLGSCSSLSSTVNQSMTEIDEPNVEPSMDLCDQITMNSPIGPLFPLAFLNTFSGTGKSSIRPRRSIRFLPKILSNDSAEAIDSPDAENTSNGKFAFPPKLIDKQTSVDSLDSLELNRCSSVAITSSSIGRSVLGRQSNSFDEQRKNAASNPCVLNSSGNEPIVTPHSKLPAGRTNSAGLSRRPLNRAPPPLRLTGMVAFRAQRSLPNSPLLKKKHDSFEKVFPTIASSSSCSTSGPTSSSTIGTPGKGTTTVDESVSVTGWKRRAPERCESQDPADQLVHCSGEQPDQTAAAGVNSRNESSVLDDDYELSLSNHESHMITSDTWAPEVGLLDSRFSSFDAESAPTSSSPPPPATSSSAGLIGASMLRTSLDWRLRSSAFDRNVSAIRAALFASNKWTNRRADTQRQPSIGSLSSDSSTHSCDECEHDRCHSRRRSSTDEFGIDSIVMVCGQGSRAPGVTHSPSSCSSPTEPLTSTFESKLGLADEPEVCSVTPDKEAHNPSDEQFEIGGTNTKNTFDFDTLMGSAQLRPENAFLLFTSLTLLLLHREPLLRKRLDANEISVYFDRLVRRHDAQQVLSISRQLFHTYLNGCRFLQKSLQVCESV